MLILRSLPDLSSNSVEFTRGLQSKWGRENCIVWGRARHAEFEPSIHALSIRAAWGGTERCNIGGRTLAVDEDTYLVLNHGCVYSTRIRWEHPVESLAIGFSPELVERACSAMAASLDQALVDPDSYIAGVPEFMENLRPHDRVVSPVLRFIRAHLLLGLDDDAWYEEQLHFLLERMQAHRKRRLLHMHRLGVVRATTRREICRRIGLATDFLHTNYSQPLELGELARIACLSKYHFLRLFTLVHGITPVAYLQRKRASVALRLLQTTALSITQIASCTGFARRTAILRQIRRWTGFTPQEIRAQVRRGKRINHVLDEPESGGGDGVEGRSVARSAQERRSASSGESRRL